MGCRTPSCRRSPPIVRRPRAAPSPPCDRSRAHGRAGRARAVSRRCTAGWPRAANARPRRAPTTSRARGITVHDRRSGHDVGEDFVEHRHQVPVEFDGHHLRADFRQGQRERAHPGTDFHDMVARLHCSEAHDAPQRVGVDHEVLAQRPAGRTPWRSSSSWAWRRVMVTRSVKPLPADLDLDEAARGVGQLGEGRPVEVDDAAGAYGPGR